MNVLVVGSGGREHTLAWKLAQSSLLTKLYIAPGNGGTHAVAENLNIQPTDFEAIKKAVLAHRIHMVVVGPEQPLVEGIGDFFAGDNALQDVALIGPGMSGARLEGSKDFANSFMERYNIPTAQYRSFTEERYEAARAYLKALEPPYVIKADGLAAGKGVVIAEDLETAENTLKEFFGGKFGEASKKVVIEQFLEGKEMSAFVLTDGENYKLFPLAKDYKRAGEQDTGLNTGGMGSLSPVTYANEPFIRKIEKKIIQPTIRGLKQENIPYQGFLYFGLIQVDNEPYVIEYNVRMGDPEAQVVIPRIKSDLLEALQAVHNHTLPDHSLEIHESVAAAVILASGGYPGKYEKGKIISIKEPSEDCHIFHAGTTLQNAQLVTSGGRVLAVTSLETTFQQALDSVYHNIEKIHFEGKYFRRDIGYDI